MFIMVLIIAGLIVFWPVIKNNKPVAVFGNLSNLSCSLSGNLTITASTAPTGESSNGSGGVFSGFGGAVEGAGRSC